MPPENEPYVIEWFAFGRAKDGGPVRWVANGHRTHPVGLLPLNKSRYLAAPWESKNVESVVLRMLAACSRVVDIVAQPHSLFIGVRGLRRQLRYTPDIELLVHPAFLEELESERPLHEIVAAPFSLPPQSFKPVHLILELKSDADSRLADEAAQTKMRMVTAIYRHVGRSFRILLESPHISSRFTDTLISLEVAAQDRVGAPELSRCLLAFGRKRCMHYGELSQLLGGQPLGERLVKALHYKNAVSIDLRNGLTALSPVWLRIADGQHGHA